MTGILLDSSGLTRPEKRAVLFRRQGGCCAVCGRAGKLVADHDHDTGILRGLLCPSDNGREGRDGGADIGMYRADPPAGERWMWDFPTDWCKASSDTVRSSGLTVLEYVKSGRYRDHFAGCPHHLTSHQAVTALESASLPSLES
jgi:Recombination endonuclease VII